MVSPVETEIAAFVKPKAEEDATGRERIPRNVIIGWLSQFIFLVAGFIIPRMINDTLGQTGLGVWDFGWSLVAYFGLVQIGVVSSINRYVAKHRAVNDIEGVNIAVSSVACVLAVMAIIVLSLTIGAAVSLPYFFGQKLGAFISDAQWVVFFLGMSLVVQILWSGYGGVLTGCHRWDLHHGVNGTCRILTLGGMVGVLWLSYGLVQLALVNLLGEAVGFVLRLVLAYRICPGLRIRFQYVRRSTARNMLTFGTKTFLPSLGELFRNQTFSLLIIWFLGPGALAFYSRPRSLIRHVRTFGMRYAFVFTPIASSLQAIGDQHALQDLVVKVNRYGAFIVLPAVLILAILGGPIVRIWMGPEYEDQLLISFLAVGYLPVLVQLPAFNILRGLNAHGKPGIVKLAASILGAIGAAIALGPLRRGIHSAVLATVLPLFLSDGVYLTLFASRYLGISLWYYVKESLFKPLLVLAPFVATLIFIRIYFSTQAGLAVVVGLGLGLSVLALIYCRYVFWENLRQKLRDIF